VCPPSHSSPAGAMGECWASDRALISIIAAANILGRRVHVHYAPSHFLAAAEPLLLSDPFSTNEIAVVAIRIMAGHEPPSSDHLWATVEDTEGQVVSVAMHTPPNHLFVSRMPREAAASLAHDLADAGRDLSGVNGAVRSTEAFAQAWTARTGRASEVVTAM